MSRIAAVFRGVSLFGFGAVFMTNQILSETWPRSIAVTNRCYGLTGPAQPCSLQVWNKCKTGLFRDPVRSWAGCTHGSVLQS